MEKILDFVSWTKNDMNCCVIKWHPQILFHVKSLYVRKLSISNGGNVIYEICFKLKKSVNVTMLIVSRYIMNFASKWTMSNQRE
jgi:hypothetical protein